MLRDLGSEDQRLFLEEKNKRIEQQIADGPLLDQICCLRVVLARLSQGYATALARFEERLEARASMTGGWRDSVTRKLPDEYESPMPWLHPFKLARDELTLLERQLEASLADGSTTDTGFATFREVLDRHGLELPLPSPIMEPRFRPGAAKGVGQRNA
jgi:hypothetical protein